MEKLRKDLAARDLPIAPARPVLLRPTDPARAREPFPELADLAEALFPFDAPAALLFFPPLAALALLFCCFLVLPALALDLLPPPFPVLPALLLLLLLLFFPFAPARAVSFLLLLFLFLPLLAGCAFTSPSSAIISATPTTITFISFFIEPSPASTSPHAILFHNSTKLSSKFTPPLDFVFTGENLHRLLFYSHN
jgi:hypothetical protein